MCRAIALFLLHAAVPVNAAVYYVRADGDDSTCDGSQDEAAGDGSCAWQTVDHAADSIPAAGGHTVRVQAGTYEERVTPGVNGASVTETNTFVADGAVTVCGWDLSDNHFIRIVGFTIDSDAGSCAQNNGCVVVTGMTSHVEFWNNTFRDGRYNGIRIGFNNDRFDNGVIIGNTFHNFGNCNGSGTAIVTRGDDNLVAHNEIYDSYPDAIAVFGGRNRWVSNSIHDLNESCGGHADGFQTGSTAEGLHHSLFEANLLVGGGDQGDEHAAQISHTQSENCGGTCGDMTENVWRRNVWHDLGSGTVGINQVDDGPITFTRYYNNTTAESCEVTSSGVEMAWYGTLVDDGFVFNNISYEGWSNSTTTPSVYCSGTDNACAGDLNFTVDYNLGWDPDGAVTFQGAFASQAHGQLNQDPDFLDYANDNFQLGGDSEATGNAGPLTTTSGAGTGTTFNVATGGGGFFRGDNAAINQYGGNLVVGDTLTVGDDTVVIASIAGDAITVTESFTWTDGEDVYWGPPDIGAYPYKPGGFALAGTYTQSGGTITVTPNDSDLVRMVVVFEDGVPVAADSLPPFSLEVAGSGALTVRMYPRYPSATLFADASEAGDTDGAGGPDGGPAGDASIGGDAALGDSDGGGAVSGGCGCRSGGWCSLALLNALVLAGMRRRRCRRRFCRVRDL